MTPTRERWRNRLPHWEVTGQPHFITIRCANSLPQEARGRIAEIHASLRAIPANSPNFAILQRQYFLTSEKYLDHAKGFRPFLNPELCEIVLTDWKRLEANDGWHVPHYVIMPNHVHFLLTPILPSPTPLRSCLRQFKGGVARSANKALGRNGAFWQSDWFDRWMRDEAETTRVIDYLRHNPVKAGLAVRWQDYRWAR